PGRVRATIDHCLSKIDRLRRRRAELYQTLRQAREAETLVHPHAEGTRTLARIAETHREQAGRYGWIAELVDPDVAGPAPLTGAEIRQWHEHLRDAALRADEPESQQRTVDLDTVPEPAQFVALVAEERAAGGGGPGVPGAEGAAGLPGDPGTGPGGAAATTGATAPAR